MNDFNIQAASMMSGVSVHQIRAWEKRYHALNPRRLGNNFRSYTHENIERLKGKYPGFGRVISGFEERERLLEVEVIPVKADIPGVVINEPKNPEIMIKVIVETFDSEFEPPVKAMH